MIVKLSWQLAFGLDGVTSSSTLQTLKISCKLTLVFYNQMQPSKVFATVCNNLHVVKAWSYGHITWPWLCRITILLSLALANYLKKDPPTLAWLCFVVITVKFLRVSNSCSILIASIALTGICTNKSIMKLSLIAILNLFCYYLLCLLSLCNNYVRYYPSKII